MAQRKNSSAQILLFPTETVRTVNTAATTAVDSRDEQNSAAIENQAKTEAQSVLKLEWPVGCVISGTYRKDPDGLKLAFQELRDIGCNILSPVNVAPAREIDGFVYMQGEEGELPESIEIRHLNAIQHCQFVWLHAPEGYVGPTAALEVGFARASGIPIFCKNSVGDKILRPFVQVVPSATEALSQLAGEFVVPPPGVQSFQHYYKRVAVQRGYDKEDAQNCLLLMVEEVGELARAIRKRKKLVRHSSAEVRDEALELADVFLYVIHMANVLDLDLSTIVREKEIINLRRFVASKQNDP